MPRNILLVEPDYKTKYPPLGLMKISSYHKALGDRVRFVKGFDPNIPYDYWDRIYVATLFTYFWKMTVETIKYYKHLVHGDISRVFVGGIMAGLMKEELSRETGIIPIKGVLSRKGLLGDSDNDLIVEDMIPDYNLFNESHHKYDLLDCYFGYATRGCVHKCPFCGVHLLEPKFIEYKGIKRYVEGIDKDSGPKQHLVFFDNNIVASKKFSKLIFDILDLGFEKEAKRDNKLRHVDFNQGVDARLLKESHFKLISKIAINPLRIAFDHIAFSNIYRENIRLAAKYKIQHLSNYILYNYNDTPVDFWKRLKINIDLNKEYGLSIYSFPMKYIPLNAKDRSFINEPNWNWQFIRSVQRILNVMKGSVMPREDFFYRAFGDSESEFMTILYMPENILMNRGRTPEKDENEWLRKFKALTDNEKKELLSLLCQNRTKSRLIKAIAENNNRKLRNILDYYLPNNSFSDDLPLLGVD